MTNITQNWQYAQRKEIEITSTASKGFEPLDSMLIDN